MRIKLGWLNELVDLSDISVQEIVDKVSLYSIEVEKVDQIVHATDIVIGHVLTKEKHPDSDHLNLLTVDIGDEILSIVCGAKNVAAGQHVIVAKQGCILDGGEIKKTKIRGYESCGMVCSLQELGIEKKYLDEKFHDGIYYFEDSVTKGTDGAKALMLDDPIIELGLTPNRGDLLSMLGVAEEFSAVFNRPLKKINYNLIRANSSNSDKLDISIETDGCFAYYGQVIKDVVIKPSPRWLISRLIAFGIRPINNCVDITNYILALYGQPLHAFDLKILGSKIIIRQAKENEEITTLDNQKRKLVPSDILITNGHEAMCIAGVMGGLKSEVTNVTKDIMLEAALFDSDMVRKTANRLNLRSESSLRFERGIDYKRMNVALEHACYLFQTLADAKIVGQAKYMERKVIKPRRITLAPNDVNKLLGTSISQEEIIMILKSLQFEIAIKGTNLELIVPSRRLDIKIKEDVIEEIGRLYGYENLVSSKPVDNLVGSMSVRQKNLRQIRQTMTSLGLNEILTLSLGTFEANKIFTINDDNYQDIPLLLPITEERQVLRTKLLPSILEVVKYNFARKLLNLSLFEIGRIYYQDHEEGNIVTRERMVLGGALANEFSSVLWRMQQEKVDFYLLKGIIEQLFAVLKKNVKYLPLKKESRELHPTRTAQIFYQDKAIGYLGQLHPQYALEQGLNDVYVFEIDLTDILEEREKITVFSSIPKLPAIERDLALVMKKDLLAADIIECIKNSDKQLLSEVIVFDLYQGDKIKEDEKSIAVKLIFVSNEAMTDEIINSKIKRILKDLQYKLNVNLRT